MLSGKTALVTDSTSGIGLGIARAMAGQGANIVFNGFGDARQIEQLHTDSEGAAVREAERQLSGQRRNLPTFVSNSATSSGCM